MDGLEKEKQALIKHLRSQGILKSKKVEKAMLKVSRHLFVPGRVKGKAYQDRALPTFKGQTISQPYVVAWMTEALGPQKGDKVLEIGTGSGWQACILAELVRPGQVYTVELDPDLVEFAKENIKKLGIKNVEVVQGDGSRGLPEHAPFDKIIVTAACSQIPKPLLNQLREGGKLIAPVGDYSQRLVLVKKLGKREFVRKDLGGVIFVPLREKYK